MPAASSRAIASPSSRSCSAPRSDARRMRSWTASGTKTPGTSLAKKSVCFQERSGRTPDEDRNGSRLHALEESREALQVVHRLGLRERGARLDLGPELRELELPVGCRRVGRAPDGEGRRGADRVAREVGAGVQSLRDAQEAEHVHFRDLPALRVVADLQRVAAQAEDRFDPEAGRPEQVRLEPEDVAVARRDLDDRFESRLPLDQRRHRDRGHAQARHRVVGHVHGVARPRRAPGAPRRSRRSRPRPAAARPRTSRRTPPGRPAAA